MPKSICFDRLWAHAYSLCSFPCTNPPTIFFVIVCSFLFFADQPTHASLDDATHSQQFVHDPKDFSFLFTTPVPQTALKLRPGGKDVTGSFFDSFFTTLHKRFVLLGREILSPNDKYNISLPQSSVQFSLALVCIQPTHD